jgi:polyhydroxyalkanoate synthase
MYLENALGKPGGVEVCGVKIDLSKIKVPCYFISTIEDHIAPWKSTYIGAQRIGSNVRFVLGGSGHIAGIVNPPSANKYGFWVRDDDKRPENCDTWLEGATHQAGSWWTDWQAWIKAQDASEVAAHNPAKGKLKALEDAPGSYVKARLDKTAR